MLAKRSLIPHPAHLDTILDGISVKVSRVGTDVLKIEYVAVGSIGQISIPAPEIPEMSEGLWQHTCFEAFVGLGDARAYVEYNFSPSRRWAMYRFEDYREGKHMPPGFGSPDIYLEQSGPRFALTAWIDLQPLTFANPVSLGISTVIEAKTGERSYWALEHSADEPDFHRRDCFIIELPPAPSP